MRYFPRYSYRKITLVEHNGRRWGECVHSELVTQGATIYNFNLRLSPFVCIQTRVQLSSKPQNAPANKSTTIFFATKRKLRCVCCDLYLLKKTQYLWPFILLMVTKSDDIPRGSLVRCSCVWIKRTSPSGLVNFSGEFGWFSSTAVYDVLWGLLSACFVHQRNTMAISRRHEGSVSRHEINFQIW